jgi:hypothetical protein
LTAWVDGGISLGAEALKSRTGRYDKIELAGIVGPIFEIVMVEIVSVVVKFPQK